MPRTILRIKRRRTEDPLPYIRLEGLVDDAISSRSHHLGKKRLRGDVAEPEPQILSDFLQEQETIQHEQQDYEVPVKKSSVLWRRMEPEVERKDSCYVVDAFLERNNADNRDENSGLNIGEDGRQSKRRKLTLLDTSSALQGFPSEVAVKPKRAKPLKVLDPLTRLVDDSLQLVHAGSRPIQEHYHFVVTDQRLASTHDTKTWLQWCHSSGGNLLHACAAWNDVEIASELLQIPNLVATLCEAVDGDGRTPYEVGQLSGHDSVCEILEAFGGDTTNFVFDVFCLEEAEELVEDNPDRPLTTVELTSGVAYWTPDGELMLEAHEDTPASLNHLNDEDGDIDSNCEEWGGNDYPDEDEWGYVDAEDNGIIYGEDEFHE